MSEIVTMPKLGFDMAEGTLVRWIIQEGEMVDKGAILAEIETDKATVEVESNYTGVVARHLIPVGDIVPVNTPIAVIAAPGEEVDFSILEIKQTPDRSEEDAAIQTESVITSPEPEISSNVEDTQAPGGASASPLARRMALEMNIDLMKVPGSGPGGRIVKKDIQSFIAAPATKIQPAPKLAPLSPFTPLSSGSERQSEIIPLPRLRAAIGRRMTEVKQQVPHFYVTHEYDTEKLMALRKEVNSLLPDEEKISVNDYMVKAVALCLRSYPNLNASLQGDQVIRHGAINIGVAVAVEGGLLTVVCRNTDLKPVRQISNEIRTMANRAREGKVRPDNIEGSTFSVSNLGMYNVEHFVAIINPPEAAILALGSARQIPIIQGDEIVPGWRMKATISVDHRISDGAEAALFLQALAAYVEEPLRLLV